jgi:hypothetical protein
VTPGDIPVWHEQHVRVLRMGWEIIYDTKMIQHASLDEFLKFKADYVNSEDTEQKLAEDFVTIRTE